MATPRLRDRRRTIWTTCAARPRTGRRLAGAFRLLKQALVLRRPLTTWGSIGTRRPYATMHARSPRWRLSTDTRYAFAAPPSEPPHAVLASLRAPRGPQRERTRLATYDSAPI